MDSPESSNSADSVRTVWVPVASVVISGLVVNWISDEISVSPPILILLAAVGLLLLAAAERSTRVDLPLGTADIELVRLSLLALLIGSAIGAISVVPLFKERTVDGPWGYFHNYELGAASALVLLAATSAVRRRQPVKWLVFLTGAIAGMTLAVVYLKPGNAFVPTFVGWIITSVFATTLIANGRDLAFLFADFLGLHHRGRPNTDESRVP